MHPKWIASMNYFDIPEAHRQPFHDWYQTEYPDGLAPVSRAYEEWKAKGGVVEHTGRNVFESGVPHIILSEDGEVQQHVKTQTDDPWKGIKTSRSE